MTVFRVTIIIVILIFQRGCDNWTDQYNSNPDVIVTLDSSKNSTVELESQLRNVATTNRFQYKKLMYSKEPQDYYSLARRKDLRIYATAINTGKFEIFFYEKKDLPRREIRPETLRVAKQFSDAMSSIDGVSNPRIKQLEPVISIDLDLQTTK